MRVFALALLLLSTTWLDFAQALPTGVSGRTLKQTGLGCASCHSVTMNQTLTVAISGPTALNVGSSATYTVTATNGPNNTNLGINVAASDDPTPLSIITANTRMSGSELVHTSAATLNTTNGVGTGSYTFTFTMPVGAAAYSSHTIYATARSGGEWNHDPDNFIVTARVNQPALTALLNSNATPPSLGFGSTATLSTSGGAGTGAVTYGTSNSGICSISGTILTAAGLGTCTITATKAADAGYNVTSDTFNLTVGQASQTIVFAALANKFTADPPFVVSATGGGSGLAVTFTASGVCSSSGTNGSVISLTGSVGSCTVTASQSGNTNYAAATQVMQSFMVMDAGGEVFPPNCVVPPGWLMPPGSTASWAVASDDKFEGQCSLKTQPLPNTGAGLYGNIQVNATYNAGNITFRLRTSTEFQYDCFQLLIDGIAQAVGGSCANVGLVGASGEAGWTAVSVPIAAGSHIVQFRYDKDDTCCASGLDSVWIDSVNLPLSTSIVSATTVFGTFNSALNYFVTGTNFPVIYGATGLPPGMSINTTTGLISGTPTSAGTFSAMVTVSNPAGANPGASDLKMVTFFIAQINQSFSFAPLNNRLNTAPAFVVSAVGGASGNPVTFTAGGVCSAGGVNGSTITLTGAVGNCSVNASQAGDNNYYPAGAVQSFSVLNGSDEIFPPQCAMPPGWVVPAGATTGWMVSDSEESSTGACSLKSMPMTVTAPLYQADIQFTGAFSAGNVSFKFKTSSELGWKCLQFFIDGAAQNLGGNCANRGLVGASGESAWISVSVPIAAGTRTLKWRYDKDSLCCVVGRDAAWIDDVILPLFTLTVVKAGAGGGNITSTPAAIDCGLGGPCSAILSGNVLLTPNPAFLTFFAGWSGGGCTGTAPCTVTMNTSKTVTGTFNNATAPGAPQNVTATPGNQQVSVSFNTPVSDGGAAIGFYHATCSAAGQTTRFNSTGGSPIVVSSMVNGVEYGCTVSASNFAGGGPSSSPPALVTPRTVPDAPTGLMATAGNAQATLTFTLSAGNGGSPITGYTATCTSMSAPTRTGTSMSSPITVSSMVNGATYDCSLVGTNGAGNSAPSNTVTVTPLSVPGAPLMPVATPRDGRGIFQFDPPASDGGSPIIDFTVTCNPGSLTATSTSSPVTRNLTNGTSYTCSVVARNALGNGPAASFAPFTPAVQPGSAYWAQVCVACHGTPPTVPQLNAAGTTASVLSYAITNQPTMAASPQVVALTTGERAAIAAYLAGTITPASETTSFNTPKTIDLAAQISVGTVAFESLEVVTGPANGMLSAFTGTSITYTPNAGFVGTNTFTFRGKRTMPTALNGDLRTVTITVSPPPTPSITSGATASGTNGVVFNYQIAATNSPTSFGATGLPSGLTVNTMTGAISGTPTVGGTFGAMIFAANQGGTGVAAALTITLNAANQTITFLVQTPASRAYSPSPGNTFAINPLATATSTLTVAYGSATASVCTVSGTTVTMLAAGTCTITADQAGNASFNVAPQATRDVTITPIIPGAPTIGAATPGNLQATIAFTAPANTGGSAITSYAVSCTPSGTGTNTVSPVTVTGLANGTQYTCSVRASNVAGQGPASGTVMVTPAPTPTAPVITGATSTTFTVSAPGTFTFTSTGNPAPSRALTGTLPSGVNFTAATGVLAGTPALGTVGAYALTITATNGVMPDAMQPFTLNVAKTSQTISFTGPGTQSFSVTPVAMSATASSALTVSFVSTTPTICTVAGANVTLVSVGTCSITAQQTGDANYNAASTISQSFSVVQGPQTITFGAQASPRAFVLGATFGLTSLATASSNLAVTYSSLTTTICTIVGTTVTMQRAGLCAIAANQAGNTNFSAAPQVSQTISLTGAVPGAPSIGTGTSGDGKATIAFTAPASDGGSTITSYTATCGGITGSGSVSPVTVTGLTNGMSYSCSVTAANAFGTGAASGTVNVTPNPLPGAAVWAATCGNGGCHGNPPLGTRLNVGGATSTALDYVIPRQPIMNAVLGSMSAADRVAVSQYIRDFIPAVAASTPLNTAVGINVGTQVFLNTPIAALTALEVVTPPANGSLSTFTGTNVTYTPTNGYTGTDSFTYRAKNTAAPSGPAPQGPFDTDVRTVTINVTAAAPTISSAGTATGTINQAFSYQIIASNAPTGYSATGLPGTLSVNPTTGLISGTPTAAGTINATVSAMNAGGSGSAPVTITINLIAQTITFGAQSSPIAYVQNGVVMISPVATGGASGNLIVYSSSTPGVCSVTGGTFTMLTAGVCTIAANQAGNATYAAAAQVTRSVTINPVVPGAPTIGAATAGNTQASIAFTAPASNGGSPITVYTATCTGGFTGSAGSSPVTVTGLTNGVAYTCSVTATNAAALTGAASGNVTVTPVSLAFTGVVESRKTHGAYVGNITIASGLITGPVTVEPRSIGAGHRIVFKFNNPVTSVTAVSVTDAVSMPIGSATASFPGNNELIVTLTGIPDYRRVMVTVTGANGAVNASAVMGFLVGDVNDTRSVNAADISAVKANLNQAAGAVNFRMDFDANGTITGADVSTVKARSGLVLP